mgnify:CR=1 FL=1
MRLLTTIATFEMIFLSTKGTFWVNYEYKWLSAFSRPVFIIISIRVLRQYILRFAYVMKDSFSIMICIIIVNFYFAFLGQRLFLGTLEGVQYFKDFPNSMWNLFVLTTTANFPDIMLPAYQRSGYYCAFFVLYLIINLFLLMNLLLAIFYSNFVSRFEGKITLREEKRRLYFKEKFLQMRGPKNYLTIQETY